jgi:eukaryotic-like serine/threonine-protein kinase
MVSLQGVVKLADFGIAAASLKTGVAHTGRLSGKISYMPPEQLRGESVDRRADLYAVGVMLAEAATGNSFWGQATHVEIAGRISQKNFPSLDAIADEDLRRICSKAMSFDRQERYATAHELKEEIDSFLQKRGKSASTADVSGYATAKLASDLATVRMAVEEQIGLTIPPSGLPFNSDMSKLPTSDVGVTPSSHPNSTPAASVNQELPSPANQQHANLSKSFPTKLVVGIGAASLAMAALVFFVTKRTSDGDTAIGHRNTSSSVTDTTTAVAISPAASSSLPLPTTAPACNYGYCETK